MVAISTTGMQPMRDFLDLGFLAFVVAAVFGTFIICAAVAGAA